jgi:anaerobic ribonucleoside-triphosphate reductase
MSKDERISEINKEIKALKEALPAATGNSDVEVYSRICGYARRVKHWNPGKRAEYKQRIEYKA